MTSDHPQRVRSASWPWILLLWCLFGLVTQAAERELELPDGPIDERFDNDELRRYALARLEVERVQQDYRDVLRLSGLAAAERGRLVREANEKMLAALAQYQLTPELYNAIGRAAATRPALRRWLAAQRPPSAPTGVASAAD